MKKSTQKKQGNPKIITRKQAIKKVGVTALTAASIFFLETKSCPAASPTRSDTPTAERVGRDRKNR